MEMVQLLPTAGNRHVLHLRVPHETPFDGVGRLCASFSFLRNLSHSSLSRPIGRACSVVTRLRECYQPCNLSMTYPVRDHCSMIALQKGDALQDARDLLKGPDAPKTVAVRGTFVRLHGGRAE